MKRVAILLAGALVAAAVVAISGARGDRAAVGEHAVTPLPPAEAAALRASAPAPALAKVADDRDGVGPCPQPYASIPVVRSGRDAQGRPTWWHEDGSCTMCVVQVARQGAETYEIPAVVHLRPLPRRR